MPAYRLLKPAFEHPAGTIVYPCNRCDYGCAIDDTRVLQTPCRSMTLDPNGGYPFFVVPERDMEAV